MSIVIIGGHDRMVQEYKTICKRYKCKAKIFTQMHGTLRCMIGQPDVIILFTNTVSHKMVRCALDVAESNSTCTIRSHSSSASALNKILQEVI